jgi:hypothetical protein
LLTITGSRVLGVRPHFVWVDLQLQNVIPDWCWTMLNKGWSINICICRWNRKMLFRGNRQKRNLHKGNWVFSIMVLFRSKNKIFNHIIIRKWPWNDPEMIYYVSISTVEVLSPLSESYSSSTYPLSCPYSPPSLYSPLALYSFR